MSEMEMGGMTPSTREQGAQDNLKEAATLQEYIELNKQLEMKIEELSSKLQEGLKAGDAHVVLGRRTYEMVFVDKDNSIASVQFRTEKIDAFKDMSDRTERLQKISQELEQLGFDKKAALGEELYSEVVENRRKRTK
jgi:hypothetical protein